MNISVNKKTLAEELRIAGRIVPNKSPIPATLHVLVEAANDSVTLSTTNIEVAMRVSCRAEIREPGVVALPAKKLVEMLDQFDDGVVNIETDTESALIQSGGFRSRIRVYPARDFPSLPSREGEVSMLSAAALRLIIERTRFAITDNPSKYVIDGALLSLNGPVAAMVTTDGRRLSIATTARPEGAALTMLVPSQTLDALTALCDGNSDVEVSCGERHLFFSTESRTLISRMIDGNFPKYDKVIPRNCDKHVVGDRAAMAAAIRRVCVIAGEAGIIIDLAPGEMQFSARTAGLGDAVESLPVQYDGEPLKIIADGKHILHFLERAVDRSVKIDLTTSTAPLLLQDGTEFINVIIARTA